MKMTRLLKDIFQWADDNEIKVYLGLETTRLQVLGYPLLEYHLLVEDAVDLLKTNFNLEQLNKEKIKIYNYQKDFFKGHLTIESILYNPKKGYIDNFNGLRDLEAKKLVLIGNNITNLKVFLKIIRISATENFIITTRLNTIMQKFTPNFKINKEEAEEFIKLLTTPIISLKLLEYKSAFESICGCKLYNLEVVDYLKNDLYHRLTALIWCSRGNYTAENLYLNIDIDFCLDAIKNLKAERKSNLTKALARAISLASPNPDYDNID